MTRTFALAALLTAALSARAADLDILSSATNLLGNGRIHETTDRLEFHTAFGAAVSLRAPLREHLLVDVGASTARLPATLHENGEHFRARPLRATPVHATLLAIGDDGAVQPYFGAGVVYLPLRDSHAVNAPDLHVARIENPDHPALLVQGGVRVRTSDRVSFIGDVKTGPAAATLETVAREFRREGLQTNVHPLVVSTGVALHF